MVGATTAVAGSARVIFVAGKPEQEGIVARPAAKHRLPALHEHRRFTEAAGWMPCGPDIFDICWRVAGPVDKFLQGAKPADLPVKQRTKVELVICLKTAKALRVMILQSLLLRTR